MRVSVALYLSVAIHLAGCDSQPNIGSYSDLAHLTFQTDAQSTESVAASDGSTLTKLTRKYRLKNNGPMPMHVRLPPLAIIQRTKSSMSQISQNDDAFAEVAGAFGKDRTISLEPGQKYGFEITSSWFLTAEASPDDITTTFVFGLPEKKTSGFELIGEVMARPEGTGP